MQCSRERHNYHYGIKKQSQNTQYIVTLSKCYVQFGVNCSTHRDCGVPQNLSGLGTDGTERATVCQTTHTTC